jgi:hypothetical protein
MDLGGQDLRAQIYGQERIPEPPHLSTFKRRGGGVRNRGRTSPTATIRAPGSTTHIGFQEPPRLSTFKRRGGGGSGIEGAPLRRLRSERPDQWRTGNPTLLSSLLLINVGPSPAVSPPEPPLPCSLSSTSLHSMALLQSIVLLPAAMCPPLSTSPVHASSWHTFPFFSFSPDTSCQVFFISQLTSPPPSVPPPYDFPVISLRHCASS